MSAPGEKPVPVAESLGFMDEDDDREPTKEEIMEDLRIALREAIADENCMPARVAIHALLHRLYGNAASEPT